jgi:hypothetical protein
LSFYHLTLGAGIMIDKARLQAGESTVHVAIQAKHEVAGLDNLCQALSGYCWNGNRMA